MFCFFGGHGLEDRRASIGVHGDGQNFDQPLCYTDNNLKGKKALMMSRSEIMSRVRSKNTKPEMRVRSAVHRAGFRFRLHRADLPGHPDLVFPRYRLALFVHGCFWHRHGCKRTRLPATNRAYWCKKFSRTIERDRRTLQQLKEMGWATAVIWECELESGISCLMDILRTSAQ